MVQSEGRRETFYSFGILKRILRSKSSFQGNRDNLSNTQSIKQVNLVAQRCMTLINVLRILSTFNRLSERLFHSEITTEVSE